MIRARLFRIWRRAAFALRRAQLYRELNEELEFHRSLKQQKNEEAGLGVDLGRKQMGNITLAKEESRDMWSFLALERIWQDVRYGMRVLRKSPVFTLAAALSLALGIGGNAAIFSLVDALLIRPLPYFEPDRLVRITELYPKAALVLFQQQSRAMEVAYVTTDSEFNLTGVGEAVRLIGSSTSANFFSVLGAPLQMGRAFEAGENRPGQDQVVILSHSLWRIKFGSDPLILGRMIRINGINRQVVGVMPADFSFPSSKVQLWVPTRLDASNIEDYWGDDFEPLIARLRPGANLAQARTEIRSLVAALKKMFPFPMPRDWNRDADVIPLQQDLVGEIRGKLLILFSCIGMVLLIACANVASLLLSRAATRRKEIALRAALGAGRWRIVRQLLTESITLGFIGGALGILLAIIGISVFRSVLPADTPGLTNVGIDWRVLEFIIALALGTGLAFGMAPALSPSQIDLNECIRTGSQRSSGKSWSRARNWLVAAEIALTLVLVVSAGLLIKSLYALSQVNPGFHPEHLLTIRINPNQSLCRKRMACVALYDDLLRQARTVSGVLDAAVANTVPLDSEVPTIPVDVEGHPKTADFPAPMFWIGAISPDYLRMLRIPLLAGRGFMDSDGASSEPVVLITQSTAKRFWPNQNPMGKHIKPVWDDQWRTVIGVVGDVRQYNLLNNSHNWIPGAMYMPYAQSSVEGDHGAPAAMDLIVKTLGDSSEIAAQIRRLAIDRNPNVPVSKVQTMEAIFSVSTSDFRSTILLFISFAIAALVLAGVGIYGVVSYWVAQRTYEIGVRVAMGATGGSIAGLVMAQGLRLALVGIAAGVVTAVSTTRFLSSLLYGVGATDPLIFVAVTVFLFGIAVTASFVPAWRAARIDPIQSLRVE